MRHILIRFIRRRLGIIGHSRHIDIFHLKSWVFFPISSDRRQPPNGTLELELGFQKYLVLYYKKLVKLTNDNISNEWKLQSKYDKCVEIVNVLEAMSLFAFKVKSCV